MGIDAILGVLASVLADSVVVGGVRMFIKQQNRILGRTIKSTAAAFTAFEGVEISLRKWSSSDAFADMLERLVSGERDFFEEIVESFIQEGDFYHADDYEKKTFASNIISLFFGLLLNELYRSDDGISLLANRVEQISVETSHQLTSSFASLEAKLTSLSNAVLTPEDSVNVDTTIVSENPELIKNIDLARDLIDRGLIRSAHELLLQIDEDSEYAPEALKFRVKTNLAACALAEDDVEKACALFEEAYEIDPSNPKGIANAAVAAHLKDDPDRAISLSNQLRDVEPENSQATAVLLGALWQKRDVDELETLINTQDWIVRDQRCAQVVIGVRTEQSRIEDAVAIGRDLVNSFPDDADAYLALSQCLFYRWETERHVTGYSEDLMDGFSEVVAFASRAIELFRNTQLTSRKNTALVVRGSANAIKGDTEIALRDFDEVLAEQPDHADALYNKGLSLLGAGEPTDAKACFELIDDLDLREESLLPVAVANLDAGEATLVVEMLMDTLVLDQPTWNDVHRAEILRKAAREAALEDPLGGKLDDALDRSPTDPKLLILSALGKDTSDETDDIICRALKYASEPDRLVIPEFLAQHYQRLGRFSEAADQLALVVNRVASHPSVVNYLMCLAKSARIREALDLIRQIRNAEFPTPRVVLDLEVDLLHEAGDIRAAVARLEEICSGNDVSSFDRVRLAAAQFRYGKRIDARATINGIKASELGQEPSSILLLAQLKLLLEVPGYLEDAYLGRQLGGAYPDVQLGYFAMFQGQEKDWEEPTAAGPGRAALLNDGTTERWWHIKDATDNFSFPDYLEATDELAQMLDGKTVGETVVLKRGLEDLVCEITAIQSKFVRAIQEIFNEFTTRFPGNPGFYRVRFENNDFSKLFQTVDDRDQFGRRVKGMYEDEKLPFSTFAHFIGRSELELWDACTRSRASVVRFGRGDSKTAEAQVNLLRRASHISLDLLALLTVRELGLADLLRDRFERVFVPQKVIDEIQKQYALMVIHGTPSGWLGKTEDGGYSLADVSERDWDMWKENVRSILEFAESFDRIASFPLLDVSNRLELIDVITLHGAGAIFAGEETASESVVVVSDDLGLSELGQSIGIDTVNTQAILLELLRSNKITEELYSSFIERLASLNYWFVRVTAIDIVRGLEKSSYVTSHGTRMMIKTLEGPGCSEDSAVSVATNLTAALAIKAPLVQAELILNAVIAALRRGRNGDHALRRFRSEISQRLHLVPLRRDQLLRVIDLHMQI